MHSSFGLQLSFFFFFSFLLIEYCGGSGDVRSVCCCLLQQLGTWGRVVVIGSALGALFYSPTNPLRSFGLATVASAEVVTANPPKVTGTLALGAPDIVTEFAMPSLSISRSMPGRNFSAASTPERFQHALAASSPFRMNGLSPAEQECIDPQHVLEGLHNRDRSSFANQADAKGRVVAQACLRHFQVPLLEYLQRKPAFREEDGVERENRDCGHGNRSMQRAGALTPVPGDVPGP